jgi:hypothetical protein
MSQSDAGGGADALATFPDASNSGMDAAPPGMDASAPLDAQMPDTGMMAMNVPDPGMGNMVDNNFASVEPNDTPSQATPLGTASSSNVNLWVNSNNIGGGNLADYFVFKTGPMPAMGAFNFSGLCFSGVTQLTATLWTVSGGQAVQPPVHTWNSAGTGCLMAQAGDAVLLASTVYLFEISSTGGSAGMYTA